MCDIRLPRLSISLLFMSLSFWYTSFTFGALYLVTSIVWLKVGLLILKLTEDWEQF